MDTRATRRLQLPPRLLALSLVAFLVGGSAPVAGGGPPPRPRLVLQHPAGVRIDEPVTVVFDRPVENPAQLRVDLHPAAAAVIRREQMRVVISPIERWQPAQRYTLDLFGATPRTWQGSFPTQPRVAAEFHVDGQPIGAAVRVWARSRLELAFSTLMRPTSVAVVRNGQPLAAATLHWAPDAGSVALPLDGLTPYAPAQYSVGAGAVSAMGDPLTDPGAVQVTMLATIPANATTGVGAGFQPRTPVEIVVENSGPARPQAGLQDADVVYEYLSEYQTTRMTGIYFNRVPAQVGPVRSCRIVNTYLTYAYSGVAMCTGASDGTLHYIFAPDSQGHPVAALMEPFDQGGHFYRSGARAVPHNAYTSADRAERLRSEWPQPPGDYAVDPPHADVDAGQPAEAPSVPPHSVGYIYDGGSQQYLRFDHGTPFVDQDTGAQVHAKNVVLLHVPFHDAGWVEDDYGGAHSIWYHMLGSGPAEIYSDGRLISATWHMGSGVEQPYSDNHAPVWFTDASGAVVLLNTGLTWIHVLGNGQNS